MRPELLNPLFQDAGSLPSVGPQAKRALARLGVERVRDLLFHFPIGWRHTKRINSLKEATDGDRVSLKVLVGLTQPSSGRGPWRVMTEDADGQTLILAFFGPAAGSLARRLEHGATILVAGKLDRYGGRFQMVHPDLPKEETPDWDAVYPQTEGMGSKRLAGLAAEACKRIPALAEWIEPTLRQKRGWPMFAAALADVHGDPETEASRDRLAYDEMLASQLAWALVRARRRRKRGQPLKGDGRLSAPFLASLPFRPTGAQAHATSEISADMAAPHAMLRLLQGDVGSGKTLVALLALLNAVEAGAQGVMLAPTDILARQHMATFQKLLGHLPVRLGFLSGREKGKLRERLLEQLEAGEIDILVGTHAIFMEGVRYHNLGVAIIDEQHRFGVAQRLMLSEKAERPPHLLVMTATPIPRTLALANFGEMDVSKLDERPPGRQPIDTRVIGISRLDEVLAGLERHMETGQQAYWVCPLLDAGADEESDPDTSATPAVVRADILRQRFGDKVALVHGKLKGAARDLEMGRFQSGDASILVATTVIEVGVDVPNATLMVIECAERFGLAQLHQLRGRVGRGSEKSVCLLLRSDELSLVARERLKMMRSTDDGFEIAEADLRLRGHGELLGTRQSGDHGFSVATPEQVERLLALAHTDARMLLESNDGLDGERGMAARNLLYIFEKDAAIATLRSG